MENKNFLDALNTTHILNAGIVLAIALSVGLYERVMTIIITLTIAGFGLRAVTEMADWPVKWVQNGLRTNIAIAKPLTSPTNRCKNNC